MRCPPLQPQDVIRSTLVVGLARALQPCALPAVRLFSTPGEVR